MIPRLPSGAPSWAGSPRRRSDLGRDDDSVFAGRNSTPGTPSSASTAPSFKRSLSSRGFSGPAPWGGKAAPRGLLVVDSPPRREATDSDVSKLPLDDTSANYAQCVSARFLLVS